MPEIKLKMVKNIDLSDSTLELGEITDLQHKYLRNTPIFIADGKALFPVMNILQFSDHIELELGEELEYEEKSN